MNLWGWATVVLFGAAWLPQMKKTWQTKSVEDISLGALLLPLVASITGAVYTYQIDDKVLLGGYLWGVGCTGLLATFYFRYKR